MFCVRIPASAGGVFSISSQNLGSRMAGRQREEGASEGLGQVAAGPGGALCKAGWGGGGGGGGYQLTMRMWE